MARRLGVTVIRSDTGRHRPANLVRHLDGHESLGRIEIRVAALIDHAKIAIGCGLFVVERSVDFVLLKRCLKAWGIDTHDKEAIALSFHPTRLSYPAGLGALACQ